MTIALWDDAVTSVFHYNIIVKSAQDLTECYFII